MRGSKRKNSGGTSALADMPDYEVIALVLQSSGALGAYQAGVYEGLHEAGSRA
jgi:NTE family protein